MQHADLSRGSLAESAGLSRMSLAESTHLDLRKNGPYCTMNRLGEDVCKNETKSAMKLPLLCHGKLLKLPCMTV